MNQFSGLNFPGQQVFQQPQFQTPQTHPSQSPQAFNMPTLTVLEQMHNLLESYRNSNPKAYPDDLRQQASLEINKLRMFEKRMAQIPQSTEQLMQTVFTNNVLPFLNNAQ